MNTDYAQSLATQFDLEKWQVTAVIDLLDEGNTIPFIARYRKEAHGSLDDQKIRELSDRLTYLRSLDEKRDSVYSLIEGAGAMTDEIASALSKAQTLPKSTISIVLFVPNGKPVPQLQKKRALRLWPKRSWLSIEKVQIL